MEAVFLKLVNMSLTASWLVLAVLLLQLVLKDAPKYIRVLLWGIVGLRLVFPFSLESMFSLIPSAEPLPQEFLYAAAPQVNTGIPVINNAINPIIAQSFTPAPAASANPTQIWSFIFSQVWILGMVLMVGYALISYLLVRRKVAASIKIGKNLRICDHLDSPFILGIFRPVIYLPSELDQKTADLVLAHEYAHLKRHDHWWKPLGFALLCVYWFNPVMWVAYVLLCRDIELACDEKVIRELGTDEKKAYSTALLHCSVPRKFIAACPLAFGEVGVKDRIKSVLNYKKPAFWIILIAVIACIVFAVCFLTDPEKPATPYEITKTLTAQEAEWAQVTIWEEETEHISLEKEEIEELVAVLAQLEDRDFTESHVDHKVSLMLHCADKEILLQTDGTYTQFVLDSESGAEIEGTWAVRNEALNTFFRKFYPFENSLGSQDWNTKIQTTLHEIQSMDSYHIRVERKAEGEIYLTTFSTADYFKFGDTLLRLCVVPEANMTEGYLRKDGALYSSISYTGGINWVLESEDENSLLSGNTTQEEVLLPWMYRFLWNNETCKAISRLDHSDGGYSIRLKVNEPIDEPYFQADSYHVDFRFDEQGNFQHAVEARESGTNKSTATYTVIDTTDADIQSYITAKSAEYSGRRLMAGTYIPIECVYMNPASSYYPGNVSKEYVYTVTEDGFHTASKYGLCAPDVDSVDWAWEPLYESDKNVDFLITWLDNHEGIGVNSFTLYQKLDAGNHLLILGNGDILLVHGQAGRNEFESMWAIYRLVPEGAENLIVEQFPDTVVQSWQNSRDGSKSVVYLNPETGEYYDSSTKLDYLIRQTILNQNGCADSEKGVWLENHYVLGETVACGITAGGDTIGYSTFYILAQVSEVTSEGGELQVLSSRTFPVILGVTENADREMTVTDYWQAEEGADPEEALQANFPSAVVDSLELTTRQYSRMLELLIQIQARYYFGIYPWTVVGDIFEDLAQNQPPITMNLDLDGQSYQTHEAWNATNSTQYSRTLCDFSFEEITEAEAQKGDNSTGIVFSGMETHLSITFYEGTNDIQVWSNNDIHYYRASYLYDKSMLISDLVRSWFDEAEYYDLLDQWILQAPMVHDYGQDYLTAAQEFSQRYEDVKLKTNPGSAYRYSFVKCEVEQAMDATNLARTRGEIDENGYAFWVNVYFVPENDRAMQLSMAGNTHEYTGSDPDIPAGAYVYTRCGYITQTKYGWVGEIVGTAW